MRFTESLRVLMHAFPSWDIKPAQAATWNELLRDVEPAALHAAAIQLARESRFPPTVAEWRDRALSIVGKGKAGRMTAAEAWDEMYRNRRARYAGKVVWSSEAVRRAAQAVRWDDPDWLAEQVPTIRAQFERYFLALADKAASIDAAQGAIEMAPQVQALLERPILHRVENSL